MKKQQTISGRVDFSEIDTSEEFEDFVSELIQKYPGVGKVEKTGRGPDRQVDIFVNVEQEDCLTGTRTAAAVVQCRHTVRSGRSVTPAKCRPLDALLLHKADIYLLVTSTRPSSSVADVLKAIGSDSSSYGKRGTCWDCAELERQLFRQENENILIKYFPKSYAHSQKQSRPNIKQILNELKGKITNESGLSYSEEKLISTSNNKDKTMRHVYLIRGLDEAEVPYEIAVRQYTRSLGINLETSSDALSDQLWSVDNWCKHEKFLRKADGVFAFITKKSAQSPNVWIEIEMAETTQNLKAIFIDKSVYTVTLFGHYPCIVFDNNESQSLDRFVHFYRSTRQQWGDLGNTWFWFGISALLCYFRPELRL